MLTIDQTAYYQNISRKHSDIVNIAKRFNAVQSKSEFLMLCDLFGYREVFPEDVFMYVLSNVLIDASWSRKPTQEKIKAAHCFLDVVYELLVHTAMFDKVMSSKVFIKTCGRWMGNAFARKDTQMTFLKLSKILGYAAEKLLAA